MAITVYNRSKEMHDGPYNFPIYRGKSILGNPFTHIKDRSTKAMYVVDDRDAAIDAYSHYFDIMYGSDKAFTKEFDKIYEAFKNGKDIYLECYCCPQKCHGDIIADRLRRKLIKEKIEKFRKNE